MTVSTLDILSFKYILGTLGLLADDLGCFVWFEDGDRIAPALFGCSLDDGFDATCFGTECFFNGFSPDLELAPSLDPAWFWAGSKSPTIMEPTSVLSVTGFIESELTHSNELSTQQLFTWRSYEPNQIVTKRGFILFIHYTMLPWGVISQDQPGSSCNSTRCSSSPAYFIWLGWSWQYHLSQEGHLPI